MQHEINLNSMARRMQQFAEAHGGKASYSDCLESAAQMLGFSNYRAYRAHEESFTLSPFPMYQGRVFDTVLEDAEAPSDAAAGKYQVVVSYQKGNSFVGIDVLPNKTSPAQCDGLPMLSLNVEVSDGLPVVRFYNSPFGDCLGTVHGMGEGVLVEEGNVPWTNASGLAAGHPMVLKAEKLARSGKTGLVTIEVPVNPCD